MEAVPGPATSLRAVWPEGEGDGGLAVQITDRRNWITGLHGGSRRLRAGNITPAVTE